MCLRELNCIQLLKTARADEKLVVENFKKNISPLTVLPRVKNDSQRMILSFSRILLAYVKKFSQLSESFQYSSPMELELLY